MSVSGEVDINIQASDEAGAILDSTREKLGEIGNVAETSSGKMAGFGAASEASTQSLTQSIGAISSVTSSLFGMYMMTERVQQSQITLDRANLRVSNGMDTAAAALKRYNEALAQYGPNSAQATQAATDLGQAQEKLRIDQERADMAQQQYNNSLLQIALFGVPTAITALSALPAAYAAVGNIVATVTGLLGGGGSAAALTASEMLGLGQGGISASEAMALVGEGATSTASGLTAAAAATAAVVGGVAVAIGAFIGMGAVLVQTHKEGESFRETYGRIADGIHERFPGIAGDIIAAMALVPTGALQMAQDASAGLSNIWGQISSSTQGAMSQIGASAQGAAAGAMSAFAGIGAALGAIPLTTDITVNSLVDAAIGGFNQTVAAIAAIPLTKNVTIGSLISDALAGIQAVISALAGIVDKVVSIFVNWQVPAFPSLNIPGFQTGGILPYTGLFYGHKGEEVLTPAQQAASAPSSSAGSSTTNFSLENKTLLSIDGQIVASVVESKFIQRRKIASSYG